MDARIPFFDWLMGKPIRTNDEKEFDWQFSMPPFQPIDLYFVFDLSFSMKPDLEKLQQYSSVLFEKFWCLFPDEEKESFHVGIGTFIDKEGFQKIIVFDWLKLSKRLLKTILSDFRQLCQKMMHFNTIRV